MENKLQIKDLRNKLSLLLCLVAFLVCAQGAWANATLGPVGIYMDVNNTKSWYKIYQIRWDYTGCTGWEFNGDTYLDKQEFGTVTSLKISGLGIIGWISPNTSGDWVATEARYWFDQSSEPSSPNKYNVGGYDAKGACPEGHWACVDTKDNGKDVVIGYKSDVDILSGLAVGYHTLYVKPYLEKRYNDGGWDWKIDCATAKATFTVPGYSPTSSSKAFGNVNVGENSEVTISTTHYGSTTTATAKITGTNADQFSTSSVTATSFKVKFTPTSAGSKKATVTVTDAYSKTYTLTVTGTGVQACTTPTKDDFTVSENSKTYNGSAQTATVAVKSGITGMGNLTVKYDGSASQTNVGTYPIAVDVDAGTTYCSASNISLGNFVINPATPTADDFTYSIPANKTFDDAYAKATVSAASGVSGMGTVRVKYNGAEAADGVKNAGTYNVTFDVAAGTNYTSATGLLPTSTSSFTISKATGSITINNDQTSFCQDAVNPTVTSTRTGDGNVTYEITVGGDKADINASTGVLTYKAPGTFTVRATVAEGTNHLTASAAKEFTFDQAPNAGTLSADVAVCSGKSTTLTTTSSFGKLQWKSSTSAGGPYSKVSGGSGSETASYTTAALTQTTYYKVEATNGVCSAALSATPVTVTVNANPTLTIELTSSPGEGLVYEWEWATFSPTTNGTITAKSINRTTGTSSSKCVFGGEGDVLTVKAHPTGDVYQASYTATSNGCSTTATKDVTVTKVTEKCP